MLPGGLRVWVASAPVNTVDVLADVFANPLEITRRKVDVVGFDHHFFDGQVVLRQRNALRLYLLRCRGFRRIDDVVVIVVIVITWAWLRDVLTFLPAWPHQRVIELAPHNWRETLKKPEAQRLLASQTLMGRGTVHEDDHAQMATAPS